MTLYDLKPDHSCTIASLQCSEDIKRRLLDLGLIPGTRVTYIRRSPSGDPTSFLVRGTQIALRHSDCKSIRIKRIKEDSYE